MYADADWSEPILHGQLRDWSTADWHLIRFLKARRNDELHMQYRIGLIVLFR